MKSGFVAVVGRPNVGKSTLVNSLVGSKVAITSARPQTTRNTIRGIVTLPPDGTPEYQVVLVDTPGLHKPRNVLGERLNALVYGTLADADAVVFIVDATARIGPGDRLIAERLRDADAATIVAVNKVDAASREQVADQLAEAGDWDFDSYVAISALDGAGLDVLMEEVTARLPEGPLYFPPEETTDQPDELMAAEVVREKYLDRLRDELPHSLAVVTREMAMRPTGTLYIEAAVIVERSSQKGIVIGHRGEMLAQVGKEARQELESIFGAPVYLDLRVKVEKEWQRREELLDRVLEI
ncbi:MAG: GTPase Era [Acidimicrobiia bacterium]